MNLIPTRWYTTLFMPSCVGLVLIAIGLWLIWRRMRHGSAVPARNWGLWVAALGCTELYLFSTPLVATWLAQSLEAQTRAVKIEDLPKADAIVVLGGGQATFVMDDGTIDMFNHHSADRVERGIAAFRAGKAPVIAFGGGENQVAGAPDYADWMASVAVARGIEEASVVRGPPARYTHDECAGLAERLRAIGAHHILLSTSAFHMMRARMNYESQGLRVTDLPSDFDTRGAAEHFSFKKLIPRGVALSQSETCLKEWLGTLVLWVTGKSG